LRRSSVVGEFNRGLSKEWLVEFHNHQADADSSLIEEFFRAIEDQVKMVMDGKKVAGDFA
jgi:hypothetical protein